MTTIRATFDPDGEGVTLPVAHPAAARAARAVLGADYDDALATCACCEERYVLVTIDEMDAIGRRIADVGHHVSIVTEPAFEGFDSE